MIICPNFSDKNVLKEFNELKELVGEIGAYHIWNENNGNPIDQTKDGKPSKLFSDLLQYYNGDRAAAIKGKAKTFTETFSMWFEGSTAIDENGEPIITEFDGDRVFVSDPEYDSTKELTELDTSKIKSVDNTGSFSASDSRTKGSELDESLQYYLTNSLDERYQQDVQEYIEAYRQYFDKYDYATKENLEKELAEVNSKKSLLKSQWELEKKDITKVKEIKEEIEKVKLEMEQAERNYDLTKLSELKYGKLGTLEKQLKEQQDRLDAAYGSSGLLKQEVTSDEIADIVSKWTGIPVSKLAETEKEKILNLENSLKERVKGQLFYERFFDKAAEHLVSGGIIVMYSNEIGFVKKQIRLRVEYRLLQETCILDKNDFYLFVIRYED